MAWARILAWFTISLVSEGWANILSVTVMMVSTHVSSVVSFTFCLVPYLTNGRGWRRWVRSVGAVPDERARLEEVG